MLGKAYIYLKMSFMEDPLRRRITIMMSVRWSNVGVIYYSLMSPCQSITSEAYRQEREQMMKRPRIIQQRLVNGGKLLPLHDNARPHIAGMMVGKMQELPLETLC